MAPISKADLLADLRFHMDQHEAVVTDVYQPLAGDLLNRQPDARSWSILQCFDHLNLTHDYYMTKIAAAMMQAVPADPALDVYSPSFWGRIYLHFALNPRYSFPAPPMIVPASDLNKTALTEYLARQQALRELLGDVAAVDLRQTRVPLEKGVRFNLGDCLKVVVYHDGLHIAQADGVRQILV